MARRSFRLYVHPLNSANQFHIFSNWWEYFLGAIFFFKFLFFIFKSLFSQNTTLAKTKAAKKHVLLWLL